MQPEKEKASQTDSETNLHLTSTIDVSQKKKLKNYLKSMSKKKTNVETDENGKISKVTISYTQEEHCVRCGASKDSEEYISCFNEYCDTTSVFDNLF